MKKSVAKKLVKLLRSGEFKQTKFRLEKNNRHCCLGVLCNLALVEGVCEVSGTKKQRKFGESGEFGLLPIEVRNYAEMKTNDGHIKSLGKSLAGLNDEGKSFAEIADIIEKHVDEL